MKINVIEIFIKDSELSFYTHDAIVEPMFNELIIKDFIVWNGHHLVGDGENMKIRIEKIDNILFRNSATNESFIMQG